MNVINKTKKYAVMWASSDNIGDDIQTLSAINFLEKKGINEYSYIDREYLSKYDGPPVVLLMNGWFTTNIKNFLPSSKITPLITSFHCDYRAHSIIENNIDFFKRYEPIGCRDTYTVEIFKKHQVDCYFSGCLTLYFDECNQNTGEKYLVDIDGPCHYIPHFNQDLSNYEDYTAIDQHLPEEKFRFDLKFRLKKAKELLNLYRAAEHVVTTRIHCTMPCRAFNTKCSFAHKHYDLDVRFKGLEPILNGKKELHKNTSFDKGLLKNIRSNFDSINL